MGEARLGSLQDTTTRIPALPDDRAYAVFENACADRFAAGFRLYKLYARGWLPVDPLSGGAG